MIFCVEDRRGRNHFFPTREQAHKFAAASGVPSFSEIVPHHDWNISSLLANILNGEKGWIRSENTIFI